jgi:hypothetical protein
MLVFKQESGSDSPKEDEVETINKLARVIKRVAEILMDFVIVKLMWY